MNVSLFGLGRVGMVTATCLASRGHQVVCVDADPTAVAAVNEGRSLIEEPGLSELVADVVSSGALRATLSPNEALTDADLSIVCVRTPSSTRGSPDLAQLKRVVGQIGFFVRTRTGRPHTVVIRSDVPPGTIDETLVPLLEASYTANSPVNVVMFPDFLREGRSVADFFAPPFAVFGGTLESTLPVRDLFTFLDCPTTVLPIREAEGIKLACNAFAAIKFGVANELSKLYRTLGVDVRQVMEVFLQYREVNPEARHQRPGFAFHGTRVRNDLHSLLHLGRTNLVDLPVLTATLTSTDRMVHDLAERVLRAVTPDRGSDRRVALLGLSVESHIEELVDSPSVALAEVLLGKGIDVRIHDPFVNLAALRGASLHYVQSRLPHLLKSLYDYASDALEGTDIAVVFSSDPAVVEAITRAQPDLVFDLDGRLGKAIEAFDGYEGASW